MLLLRRIGIMIVVCVSGGYAQSVDWSTVDTTTPPITRRALLVGAGLGPSIQLSPELRCLDDAGCPPFTGGVGVAFNGMVGATQELVPGWSVLGLVGIEAWQSTMRVRDNSLGVRVGNEIVALDRELALQSSALSALLRVGMQYESDAWRFWAAPSLQMVLGTPQWQQTARILGPAGVSYPGGGQEIVAVPLSAIPSIQTFRAGLHLGARYSVPVLPWLQLEPMVTVDYSPMSIQQTQSWSDVRITGGVMASFDVTSYPSVREYRQFQESIDTVVVDRKGKSTRTFVATGMSTLRIDTVPRGNAVVFVEKVRRTDTTVREVKSQPVRLTVRRQVVFSDTLSNSGDAIEWATDDDGLQVGVLSSVSFTVITQEQTSTFTTLPLLFFEENSSILSSRYRTLSPEQARGYSYNDSANVQLEVTHDVLNVIGYRLSRQSDTMVIRAYADNTIEQASCDLARARARAVADYLQNTWGISADRLVIDVGVSTCAPPVASSEASAEGMSENRRVELFTRNSEYYLPVVQQRVTTAIESDLDQVEINIGDDADTVMSWTILIKQGTSQISTLRGTGPVSTYGLELREEQRAKLASGVPISLNLSVLMSGGDTIQTRLVVPVDVVDNNQKLQSLSLTTFDVRSSLLSNRDKELLTEFLRRLTPGDKVSVIGYSDNRGQYESNKRLSLLRAQTVAGFIRQQRPDCTIVEILGVASDRKPLGVSGYDLPEERFMSRTVQLEIVD